MEDEWNRCQALDGTCDRPARYRSGKYCNQHQRVEQQGRPVVPLKSKSPAKGEWNMCQAVDRGCGYKAQSRGSKYCKRHAEMNRQGRPLVMLTDVRQRPDGGWGDCQALEGSCDREVENRDAKYCRVHSLQHEKGKPLSKIRNRRPNGTDAPECRYEGCDKLAVAIGLCSSHANHHYAGQELKPVKTRRPNFSAAIRNENGEKHCKECDRWESLAEFTIDASSVDGLYVICKSCTAARGVVNRFNLQPGQYVQMLEQQGGACSICRTVPGSRRLSVDHDHSCCPPGKSCGKCVRGLLCDNCNNGIGNFRDDIALMEAAIAYLRTHR
ncbi:MAG: hypothetical protein JWQ56_3810 [Pseudarthrobacter sp.]|nr:hypothetical protein [Pseudarthrobacter sp.]